MTPVYMTAEGGFLSPIVTVLGWLMNIIFEFLDIIGIPNTGLAIILFTIVMYILLTPLTIKQQKFSKMSARMNPELTAVRKKYQNKKDQASMMAMNEETKALYEKYGVSPTGSCLPLLVQMPILFSLYRVIYAIPAYVNKIKDSYTGLVDGIINQDGAIEYISEFKNSTTYYGKQFEAILDKSNTDTEAISNTIIDALNKASTADFHSVGEKFAELKESVEATLIQLNNYNSFLGLNISNSPSNIIKESFESGKYLVLAGALLIPILAAATQWINSKLMPQPVNESSGNGQENSMMASMKMMTNIMPIMSAVFCLTLPAGMGIYWIAGAVVRSVQQIMINKHLDKVDLDALMKKNSEKIKKKNEKMANYQKSLAEKSNMSTKNIVPQSPEQREAKKEEAVKKLEEANKRRKTSGSSLADKANMVRDYNERNNK